MNKYLRTKSFGYHFTNLRLSDTFRTIKGFAVCFVLFFPVSLSLCLSLFLHRHLQESIHVSRLFIDPFPLVQLKTPQNIGDETWGQKKHGYPNTLW